MSDDSDETGPLEVLAVLDLLRRTGCRAWVAGGWGVDALLGRRTRAHRDLDLALDASGTDAALAALTASGYVVETDWLPVRTELYRPGHGRVDVHPVVFEPDGNGVQAGFDGEVFRYPRTAFTTGSIAGTTVGCLSAELQLTFRQGYPLRPADHHDLALLHDLTAV